MIEEQLESLGRQFTVDAIRTGGGIVMRIGEQTAALLMRWGGKSLHAAGKMVQSARDNGRMSEKRLQRLAQGDIHMLELNRDEIRKVTSSLNRAGVRYAVERSGEVTWIHFEGRDLDHVTHAVRRALDDIGYELRLDGVRPERNQTEKRPSAVSDDASKTPQRQTISKEDTLQSLRERISRKLSARRDTGGPVLKPERSRGR